MTGGFDNFQQKQLSELTKLGVDLMNFFNHLSENLDKEGSGERRRFLASKETPALPYSKIKENKI